MRGKPRLAYAALVLRERTNRDRFKVELTGIIELTLTTDSLDVNGGKYLLTSSLISKRE